MVFEEVKNERNNLKSAMHCGSRNRVRHSSGPPLDIYNTSALYVMTKIQHTIDVEKNL